MGVQGIHQSCHTCSTYLLIPFVNRERNFSLALCTTKQFVTCSGWNLSIAIDFFTCVTHHAHMPILTLMPTADLCWGIILSTKFPARCKNYGKNQLKVISKWWRVTWRQTTIKATSFEKLSLQLFLATTQCWFIKFANFYQNPKMSRWGHFGGTVPKRRSP